MQTAKNTNMLRGVLYLRVSTKVQDEAQQEPDLLRQAEYDNINIIGTYKDKISGLKDETERPDLNELLKLTKKDIDIVYIWEISRLSRNPNHFDRLIALFKEKKINICFVKPQLLYLFDKETGEEKISDTIALSIFSKFALYEIQQKGVRTARGKKNAILEKNNSYTSKPPYGYKVTDKKLIINNDSISDYKGFKSESEIVKSIYELYINGKTLSEIKKVLNDYKIPTHSAKYLKKATLQLTKDKEINKEDIQWNRRTIHNILINPIYYGVKEVNTFAKVIQDDGTKKKIKTVIGNIISEPIITESQFLQVKQQMKDNISVASKTYKNEFLLRGVLKCGFCGKQYLGSGNHGRNFYLCSDKTHRRSNTFTGCKNTRITNNIDLTIWELTKATYLSEKHKENVVEKQKEFVNQKKNITLLIQQKTKDIEQTDSQINNLVVILSKVPQREQERVLNQMDILSNQSEQLTAELVGLKEKESIITKQIRTVDSSRNKTAILDNVEGNFKLKKEALISILDSVTIYKIDTKYRVLQVKFKSEYVTNIICIVQNQNFKYVECPENLFKFDTTDLTFTHKSYNIKGYAMETGSTTVEPSELFKQLYNSDYQNNIEVQYQTEYINKLADLGNVITEQDI